ncbi:uncharacterized protein ARMOST_10216 [Armillaria ostoyae]|uniref:Uncharacterized protein n=1 Tax=Armillaria ostoyae TaxID=47428 RepID=A0A284RDP6_ARMOS|nr:uncharacterized protein ARMOST_10216 [Armillaria ostoyae]
MRCDHTSIQYYHNANIVNLERLNRDLHFDEIPNFGGTLSTIRATNTLLQYVQTISLEKEQLAIAGGSEVFMVYPGGWKLVLVDAKSVWKVLLVMLLAKEVRPHTESLPAQVLFYSNKEVRFLANSWMARFTERVLMKAETDGRMKFIRELPARYAATHAPVHKSLITSPSLPFPCMKPAEELRATTPRGSVSVTACRDLRREFRAWKRIIEILRADAREEEEDHRYPWVGAETVQGWLPSPKEGDRPAQPGKRSMECKCSLHPYNDCPKLTTLPTVSLAHGNERQSVLRPFPNEETGSSSGTHSSMPSLISSNSEPPNSVSGASSPLYRPESPLTTALTLTSPGRRPHPVINGRTPGYGRQYYMGRWGNHGVGGPSIKFRQDANNWMIHAVSRDDLLGRVEGEDCPFNQKLLEYGYLVTSKPSAAVLKGWANVDPANFSTAEELLKLCVTHHVSFRLAIPASAIPIFQKPVESYSLNSRFAADVPFMPGFHEPRLDDQGGSVILCTSYRWKASGVASRMNAGAFRALGGTLGWVMKAITGSEALAKLLDGPSYVASHLFNFDVLPAPLGGKEYLIAEGSTIQEQIALLGYITGGTQKGPRSLIPTDRLLHRFLSGFYREWTKHVELLMKEHWEAIGLGEAEALTEEEWGTYIGQFNG